MFIDNSLGPLATESPRITHRQYTTYIKQDAIITIRLYLAACFGHDRPSSGQLRTTIKVQ